MIVLIIVFFIILIYYIQFLINVSRGIQKVSKIYSNHTNPEFVSVIIPFRNEENNILKSLNSLKSQTFPPNRYEVIYINDNSDDKSFQILEQADNPSNMRILNSPFQMDNKAHKKKALKYAIKKSKGEIIITTDADCIHKKTWLETMVNCFDDNTAFVSGPVQFESDGTIYQELQKLEFSSLILVGAGLIGIEKPIICNAANLGFKKNIFNEVNGYEDNLNLSSGDDEFLMQKISRTTNYKIKFCFNSEAISFTSPNSSIKDLYQQRKRWASKGFHYNDLGITLKLVIIFLFYLSLPIQLVLGLFTNTMFFVSLFISLALKIGFEYKIVQIDSLKLFPKSKFKYFLLAQFLHIPYILISGISGIFGNYKWKGRLIKR